MEWKHYRIHAHDELPVIGSGHRTVMAKVNNEWVEVRSRVDPQSFSQRIHISDWNKIVKDYAEDI